MPMWSSCVADKDAERCQAVSCRHFLFLWQGPDCSRCQNLWCCYVISKRDGYSRHTISVQEEVEVEEIKATHSIYSYYSIVISL